MSDLIVVKCILYLHYYYSRFMGILNFEINMKTGKTNITKRANIYAAFLNGLVFSLLPLLIIRPDIASTIWKRPNIIHETMFLISSMIRILGIYTSLIVRWRKRQKVISLFNGLWLLFMKKPHVGHLYRRGVILKFVCATLAETSQAIAGLNILNRHISLRVVLTLFSFYIMTALLNVIISEYYFAMLNIQGHYKLLNCELKCILTEARILSLKHYNRRGMGVFVTRCCYLADRVDEIAKTQAKLQTFNELMIDIFGVQGFCIASAYYLTSVSVIYFIFSLIKTNMLGLKLSALSTVFLGVYMLFYFADGFVGVFIMFFVLDENAKIRKLMEDRTLLAPGLDERLETAFENFQLQLIRNPLKLDVLHLFNLKRSSAMAMTNSVIINSLLLIQYDIEHY